MTRQACTCSSPTQRTATPGARSPRSPQPGVETDRWIGNACLTASPATGSSSRTHRDRSPTSPSCSSRVPGRPSLDLALGSCHRAAGARQPGVLHAVLRAPTRRPCSRSPVARRSTPPAWSASMRRPHKVCPCPSTSPARSPRRSPHTRPGGRRSAAQIARIDKVGQGDRRSHARKSVPFELTTDADGGVVFLDHDGTTAISPRLDARRTHHPRAEDRGTRDSPPARSRRSASRGPPTAPSCSPARPKATTRTLPRFRPCRGHSRRTARPSTHGDVVVDVMSPSASLSRRSRAASMPPIRSPPSRPA